MCTRFSQAYRIGLAYRWAQILDPRRLLASHAPQYNIAPTDEALIITNEKNQIQFDKMIFGMIPHWAKDAKMGLHCLNARSETILEKPSFRTPFKNKRCLIPIDGFYEWNREGKVKLPYRFVLKNHEPFALAGLWDEWTSPHGRLIHSFCIITTEPNSLNATIHDRMPVILKPTDEEKWLTLEPEKQTELLALLKPYSSDAMETYRVSPAMNSSHHKSEDCIKPL